MPSDEPNHKMDELLKAYAKKRREQAGPAAEFHPATRKLLQGEVQRTFGTTPSPSREGWRKWRWPLVGMWSATAALVVMFALLNAQMRSLAPASATTEAKKWKDEKLATLDRGSSPPADTRRTVPAAQPAASVAQTVVLPPVTRQADQELPPPAPAIVPLVTSAEPPAAAPVVSLDTSMANGTVPSANLPPGAPAPATESSLSPAIGNPEPAPVVADNLSSAAASAPANSPAQAESREYKYARASRSIGSTAVPAASAVASLATRSGSAAKASDFVQTYDRSRAGPAPSPPSNLLSNFRMVRAGQNVSVIDADGSVYKGQVLDTVRASGGFGGGGGGGIGGVSQMDTKPLKDAMEDTNWAFNVRGVNNSLNQNIIFTGNVLAMPQANAASNVALQTQSNARSLQRVPAAGQFPSAQNSRITGEVQVVGGKAFEIEAKPPAP